MNIFNNCTGKSCQDIDDLSIIGKGTSSRKSNTVQIERNAPIEEQLHSGYCPYHEDQKEERQCSNIKEEVQERLGTENAVIVSKMEELMDPDDELTSTETNSEVDEFYNNTSMQKHGK